MNEHVTYERCIISVTENSENGFGNVSSCFKYKIMVDNKKNAVENTHNCVRVDFMGNMPILIGGKTT